MQAIPFAKAALAGLALLLLGSCGGSPAGQRSFQAQYAVARNALEAGEYDLARRSYRTLMQAPGPLEARLQLEYAHAELRGGDFAAAARTAGQLAQGQSGLARAAALAVQGTALHEIGLAQLAQGQAAAGRQQLDAARKALAEVLETHPELDPLGSMAGRRASIEARLKTL